MPRSHSGGSIRADSFGWRHAGRKLPALSDVTFDIAPGEKVLILGESGAGKSTLLSAIAGVLGGPDDGEFRGTLEVCGVDARDVTALRGKVGMLLQDPDSQVIATKVGDDVAFGCENLGLERAEIWQRVERALALVGLDEPLDHPTAELSGGQKQRLALAGVIAMGAQVIVLDEPTANIDPEGVAQLVHAVNAVAEEAGATVVVVEHRVSVWQELMDRVLVLGAGGHVRTDGPLNSVLAGQGVELARDGIWVPEDYLPAELRLGGHEPAPNATSAGALLTTSQLQSGWAADHPIGKPHSLDILAGQSTVITGPNGAGKSTLLLTLAGLLEPLSGTVGASLELRGKLSPHPHRWRAGQLAQRIGYVFQDPEHQFLSGTVRDELLIAPAMAARRYAWQRWRPRVTSEMTARADELLARLRLTHLAAASPFSLSGGQKRRLSVATALMYRPQAVFLDEPTFGQDRRTFLEIVELLQELKTQGTTLVSISHDPLFEQLLADHRLEVRR